MRRAWLLCLGLAACAVEPPPAPPPPPGPDHAAPIGPEPWVPAEYHVGEIRRNDSLSSALGRLGVTGAEVEEIVRALLSQFDFRRARRGDWFEITRDAGARLQTFRYTAGPTTIALCFRGSDGALRGLLEPVAVKTATVVVRGQVSDSLYLAVERAGEAPALTLAFVDLFAWDVDFFTETQAGDEFAAVVPRRLVDGKLIGYGPIAAAEYRMAGGRRHRAFRFVHADGREGYYAEDGTSVKKAFLKSPINFTSITSRYGNRRHPILEYVSAHRGVDYGAPLGSAIWAVGDGVVRSAGSAGGYGLMVAVQHANGLMTRYAHLRGFAPGVRAGKRVAQKETLGYVGMTGLTTGPHLHFEVLQNGRFTNPLSVAVPPAPPLAEEERALFAARIAPLVAELDLALALGEGPR